MRNYQPIVKGAKFTERWIRESLHGLDLASREFEKRLAVQITGGVVPSGVVATISADSGTDLVGDVNFIGGAKITLTQSAQDISIITTAAIVTSSISPSDIANSSSIGSSGEAARADHVHDLGTAGDLNYIRQDGTLPFTGNQAMGSNKLTGLAAATASGDALAHSLNSINHLATATGDYNMGGFRLLLVGDIIPNGSNVVDLGSSVDRFEDIWVDDGFMRTITNQSGADLTISGALTNIKFQDSDDSIIVTTSDSPNAWQTAAFTDQLIAIESITSLDELATAAADYSLGGFGLTNVDDIAGANAADLEFISNETDGSSAEAFRFNYNTAGASPPVSGTEYCTWGYTDSGATYNKIAKIGEQAGLGTVIWGRGQNDIRSSCGLMAASETELQTGLECTATTLRLTVNGNTSFQVTHSASKARWRVLTAELFAFENQGTNLTGAGPIWLFDAIAGGATPKTAGSFMRWQNPLQGSGVIIANLDHDGAFTLLSRIHQTSDSNALSAERAFLKVDAGNALWEVDTTFSPQRFNQFLIPTLTINTTKTVALATNVYIEGAPTNAGAGTLTAALALHVDAGKTQLDGEVEIDGALNHDGSTAGFYGTAPASQPAHIVDADGTLADITTKFNTLLAQLATLGLQATS